MGIKCKYDNGLDPYINFAEALCCRDKIEDSKILTVEFKDVVEALLSYLKKRYQLVIELRFGLYDKGPFSYKEIALILDVSTDMIRQIEQKSLRLMRRWLYRWIGFLNVISKVSNEND